METVQHNRITVPFNRLVPSPANVRRTGRNSDEYRAGIAALAATIKSSGLLQNLVVHAVPEDRYAVDAGQRRSDAIALLVEQGDVPKDWPVDVILVDESNALAVSVIENEQRANMHPVDEFVAFRDLTNEGMSIEAIAEGFGVSVLTVERRLKLAAAAPELLQQMKDGELNLEQLVALCAVDDHEVQRTVWSRLGGYSYSNSPADLRRAVLGEQIDASRDNRVAFIGGVEAFEAAGGAVRKDLFSDASHPGFIEDVSLLDSLVAEKLQQAADAVSAEGWKWVEVWSEFDHSTYYRFGTAASTQRAFTDDESAQHAALTALLQSKSDELEALQEAEDDLSDAEEERATQLDSECDTLQARIDAMNQSLRVYSQEVMQASGVIVYRSGQGLAVERGKVRAADRGAANAASGNHVQGGREKEQAGRKADALSDPLRRSLLGYRNLAVQIAVSQRPDVAKIVLACWAVHEIRTSHADLPCDITISGSRGTRVYHPIADEQGQECKATFEQQCRDAIKDLPKADGPLWDSLAAAEASKLDAIIALGVAASISLRTTHTGLTAKLLHALDFDIAQHFVPTAANFFGRVTKKLMVDSLHDAKVIADSSDREALMKMDKATLAAEAADRVKSSAWVPSVIRGPAPKKMAAANKPRKAKGSTKQKSSRAKAVA